MNKSKILIGGVLLLSALYFAFQLAGYEALAEKIRCFILPAITLSYFLSVKKKSTFFALFLIFYSISDVLYLFSNQIGIELDYYVGNYLYMLAYVMLLVKICKSISLLHVLKNLKIHTVVLLLLNVYVVYVLQNIITQRIDYDQNHQYYLEMSYNVIILLLLSVSLLNYFYRDNKKSLYLFLGSLCIVFSEVINVAYLYVAKQRLLDFLALSLTLLAFYFYYHQSKLEDSKRINSFVFE